MHFEFLVEDKSGAKSLESLIPKILGGQHSYRIIAYKGTGGGRVPKDLKATGSANQRILLERLASLLPGYGKTFAAYPPESPAAVVVVFDLDDKCLKSVRQSLLDLLNQCDPAPQTRFCIAVEEGEAWLLGDQAAIKTAYPRAKHQVLSTYEQDSICGTWETLADAVFPGGAPALKKKPWFEIGQEKSTWAEKITPHMDVEANQSPSFQYFRTKLLELMQ